MKLGNGLSVFDSYNSMQLYWFKFIPKWFLAAKQHTAHCGKDIGSILVGMLNSQSRRPIGALEGSLCCAPRQPNMVYLALKVPLANLEFITLMVV